MGNGIGFKYADTVTDEEIFGYNYGGFIVEASAEAIMNAMDVPASMADSVGFSVAGAKTVLLGKTAPDSAIIRGEERLSLAELEKIYEGKLESIYTCNIETEPNKLKKFTYTAQERPHAKVKVETPKVLIPVFPGTNCEYDSAKAFRDAGAETEIFVINNLTAATIAKSVEDFAKKSEGVSDYLYPGWLLRRRRTGRFRKIHYCFLQKSGS